MAFNSKNVCAYWSTSTSLSTSSTALIGEVVSFDGPSGTTPVIDITNLRSTAKEKLVGIQDEGQLTLELLTATSDAAQTNIRTDRQSGTMRKLAIQFGDDSTTLATMDAFVTAFSPAGAVDDAVKTSVTFEITGAVTWTTN